MGLIRKTASMSTLGLIDFRSDKERIARNTKRTMKAVRSQTEQQAQLAAIQAEASALESAAHPAALEAAAAQRAAAGPAQSTPAGWFQNPADAPGTLRWWTGVEWGSQTQQPAPPTP
jgi:hypothetical protein